MDEARGSLANFELRRLAMTTAFDGHIGPLGWLSVSPRADPQRRLHHIHHVR